MENNGARGCVEVMSQEVAGIPGVWCAPKEAEEVAMAWGQAREQRPKVGEWRRAEALSSLVDEPGAPGGYFPNQMEGVGVGEDPRPWRHPCQVQGSPLLGDTALRNNCLISVKRSLLKAGWGFPPAGSQ